MQAKYRPEAWMKAGCRLDAFKKVGQTIQLRTRLMPEVFEGNPTASSLGSGKALRTIQWGSNVFVAGNFGVTGDQTVNVPSGTWYNYFEQKKQTATTIKLAPGEYVILTGKECELPTITTDLEDLVFPGATEEVLPPYNVTIYNVNGQVVSFQNNVEQVNMGALKNGMYVIQFEKNGKTATQKVIR